MTSRIERAESVVRAALVWSYTNDGTEPGRIAKNALLLAIEEYEDVNPDAAHDALIASKALGPGQPEGEERP